MMDDWGRVNQRLSPTSVVWVPPLLSFLEVTSSSVGQSQLPCHARVFSISHFTRRALLSTPPPPSFLPLHIYPSSPPPPLAHRNQLPFIPSPPCSASPPHLTPALLSFASPEPRRERERERVMMAASPEFYKPPSTPFSPLRPSSLLLPHGDDGDDLYSCRTPTGTGITYLREPTTCPPAPRKAPPPPCKKRLFPNQEQQQVPVISLRLDDLHRIFRPHPHPPPDKRRRSARHHRGKLDAAPQEA